jgi:hypothetical protein
MEPLQLITALTRHPTATAFSALPAAPVVPARERRAAGAGSRLWLAGLLHRLADAVAPAGATRPAAGPTRHAWASTH